jgi:ABC-type nitrate/sulfonate/bicarbonate transport system substrate-binding protein
MADLRLRLGCWSYDRTRALMDGSVKPEGLELQFESADQVGQIMERMVRDRAYDAAELGLTYYLRTLELAGAPFIAIPVFPNRIFRHSAIFVNRASRIERPQDLAGRKVGELHRYGHDAGIWAKGVLADEYGVNPRGMTHFVGGLEKTGADADWAPFRPPPDLRINRLSPGQGLDAMLEAGEIDALFSAWLPPSFISRSPNVARLFPDYEAVERDWYRRTGVFPIMHTVVICRDLYEGNRWIARALMQAFEAAKERAIEQYGRTETFFGAPFMLPWLPALIEKNRALMGDNAWQYGLEPNRKTLETYLRYHSEQGLSSRSWRLEELFAPECLG